MKRPRPASPSSGGSRSQGRRTFPRALRSANRASGGSPNKRRRISRGPGGKEPRPEAVVGLGGPPHESRPSESEPREERLEALDGQAHGVRIGPVDTRDE